MSKVEVFVTERQTDGQTDRQTDEWVLMSPAFTKSRGQKDTYSTILLDDLDIWNGYVKYDSEWTKIAHAQLDHGAKKLDHK